jgi:mono/diheme cytochrome c family protein
VVRRRARWVIALVLPIAGLAAGCRQDMHDAPRYKPLAESDFFKDKRASRHLVEGTVARGLLKDSDVFFTGMQGTTPVEKIPMAITREVVERGRDRFNIFCAPCHGLVAEGNGMIVQRGYKKPTSFHDPRLRAERAGYFFDVMTRGFGQMPDYSAQVTPKDRWAIVAYIRALQLSQNAKAADVPAAERGKLDGGAAPSAPAAEGAPQHD